MSDGREETWRIGDVARLLELQPYVLRFWESEFPQLQPLRTETGQRLYRQEHIDLLRAIQHLLHERGMTIEGARRELEQAAPAATPKSISDSTLLREVLQELEGIRALLASEDFNS